MQPAEFLKRTVATLGEAQNLMNALSARNDDLATAIRDAFAAIDRGDVEEARIILADHAGLAADARQVN